MPCSRALPPQQPGQISRTVHPTHLCLPSEEVQDTRDNGNDGQICQSTLMPTALLYPPSERDLEVWTTSSGGLPSYERQPQHRHPIHGPDHPLLHSNSRAGQPNARREYLLPPELRWKTSMAIVLASQWVMREWLGSLWREESAQWSCRCRQQSRTKRRWRPLCSSVGRRGWRARKFMENRRFGCLRVPNLLKASHSYPP